MQLKMCWKSKMKYVLQYKENCIISQEFSRERGQSDNVKYYKIYSYSEILFVKSN